MILLAAFFSDALLYGSCKILYYGFCKFLTAFCTDLKQRLEALSGIRSDGSQAYYCLKSKLSQLVEFHCDIKNLAAQTSTVYNRVMAVFIIVGIVYMGTNLFEIHLVCSRDINLWNI